MQTPAQHSTVQQLATSGTLPSKRPRSTSIPSSPTGSASSKRAISEDDFADRQIMRAESEGVSGTEGERQEQEEVQKRTEDMHLGEPDAKKYSDLYDELLSATPPPFNDYYRYALIPTSLVKQIKSAAFESATNVQLDMSSLVADEGQEVHVMEPGEEELPSGEKARYPQHKAKKEKVWTLKKGLQEDEDFTYITEDGWNKVTAALDATTQPNLLRFCIRDTIQLSPPIYTLYVVSTSTDTATPIRFTCPTDTSLPIFLRLLQSIAAEVLGSIKSKAIRAWSFDPTMARSNNDASALASLENFYLPPQILPAVNSELVIAGKDAGTEDTCSSKGFENGDAFILELGTKEGANVDWVMDVASAGHAVVKPTINLPPVPKAPAPLFSSPAVYGGSTAASSSSSLAPESGMFTRSRNQREAVKTRGLVGLQNLGNTCFMNSAVQCLSNTPELNKYFLSSVYKDEINRENPLGMHGLIADAFGLAVEQLWSEHPSSSFSPRQLKQYTGKFAPQFQGYGQHDTQEFLAFLLDGLHEDMNRIYKKPYIEKPDWKAGGGDKELALLGKECWDGYKKRNDSVIVDLFQGQLMSTLVCPECHQESITMDPFMYLTVPLPIKQTVEFTAYFVPKDPEKDVVKLNLLISANASFAQIKDKIGALVDADPSHMIGVDLFKGAFYNWWFDGDHNGECKKSDIAVFYDVGVPTTTTRKAVGTIPTDGTITVPVYTCKSNESKYSRSNDTTPTDNCLVPFFITLTRAEAGDAMAVREAVARGYTRCLKQEMVSQLWVPNSSSHAVVPMTPAEEQQLELGTDEEKVAEIHLDGSEHRVVEVPATRSGANSPVHSLKSAHGNLSSTSLATLASTRSAKSSRLVPRADVYKIHVADASTSTGPVESGYSLFSKKERKEEPGVNSIYRGEAGKASAHWSSLESRRKAKKEKGNVLGRLTGGLFGGSDKGDDDEREGRKANGQGSSSRAASPVSGPPQPQLVVRPGEAIFVEWSSKNYNDYIDESVLGQSTTIVDPLIEKERLRRTSGKAISLEECLDEFSKEETLGQDDLWYCPVCKKHQAATKKLDIYKAPDILVICIKRFGSSRRLSDKLDNLVNFPLEGLDLSERVQERRVAKSMKLSKEQGKEYGMDLDWDEVPTEITPEGEGNMVYDLYAVDNHFGGLGGGHYTAFCKNREDGQWWNYDDSRVSRARPESVQSKAAYLLFYRRRTARPIGGISRVKAEEAESLAASRAASRAPSPAPSASGLSGSRTLAPSGLSHAMGNDEEDELASESEAETTDDEGLPSYSRSASPAVSEDGGARVNSDEDDLTSRRLSMAGHNLGFGNNAWDLGGSFRSGGTLNTDGTETAASASGTSIGVNYPFGQSSADTTMVNMPSPPASLTLGEPVREETDTDAEAASAASPAGTTLVDATEGAGEEISEPSTVRAGDRSTGTMTDPQEEATNVSIRPASDMEVDEP